MNKSGLIDAVAARTDNPTDAAKAVDAVLDAIVRAVVAGEAVSVTGFGTIEARERAARIARNPQDGSSVHMPATRVLRFRPGANFKALVAGRKALPASGSAVRKAPKSRRP